MYLISVEWTRTYICLKMDRKVSVGPDQPVIEDHFDRDISTRTHPQAFQNFGKRCQYKNAPLITGASWVGPIRL